MPAGKLIFSQLTDWIHPEQFRRCVNRYAGNYKVCSFPCWDQFLAMTFAQLTYRESLADIEVCLRARSDQLYRMGFRAPVAHSTLADANRVRDWRIYADLAQLLIARARRLYAHDPLGGGVRPNRLRFRFNHHRPLLELVPLGALSDHQGGHQTSHVTGFARANPNPDCDL
jgi:hypothetical protein